jgi:hypothetical protein
VFLSLLQSHGGLIFCSDLASNPLCDVPSSIQEIVAANTDSSFECPCHPNTFRDLDLDLCVACPTNTVTPVATVEGRNELADCVAAAGYYGANGQPATACPAGSFKSTTGGIGTEQADCMVCDTTTYNPATAATVCVACPSGTRAPVGTFAGRDELADCRAPGAPRACDCV